MNTRLTPAPRSDLLARPIHDSPPFAMHVARSGCELRNDVHSTYLKALEDVGEFLSVGAPQISRPPASTATRPTYALVVHTGLKEEDIYSGARVHDVFP